MRIGVFGDSFVDKHCYTWADRLQTQYGHEIVGHGEGGSSVIWSARQVDEMASQFDLVIWAMTNLPRLSVEKTDKWYHFTEFNRPFPKDPEIDTKRKVFGQYLKYVHDWHSECWQWQHIVQSMMAKWKNIMVVPCFPDPLYVKFSLYQLCEREAQCYFPGSTIVDIYQSWNDLRPGHLCEENHDILARDIQQRLVPGVYQTSYEMFVMPTGPQSRYWSRR